MTSLKAVLLHVLFNFVLEHYQTKLFLVSQTLLDGLALSLISRLVEQRKHVLLVSLNTRLIEGVDTKDVATDTASNLEEVDNLSEVILVELGNRHADVRHAAIDVSQTCAELSHTAGRISNGCCASAAARMAATVVGRS